MRWENLFDDLESQLEHELGADEVDLLAEEERLRLGRLGMRDRIRAMSDGAPSTAAAEPLRLELTDGTRLGLRVSTVGRDWLAGDVESTARRAASAVVPLDAIAAVFPSATQLGLGLAAASATATGDALTARLGLAFVLRDLCRRRTPLDLLTRVGPLHGTIDRVARDHVDVAEHERGVPRRERSVTALRMLPTRELLVVRF
jgi:hypothetical protein